MMDLFEMAPTFIDWEKQRQVIAQLESQPWIHRPVRGTINNWEALK
jgi:hypothetical protein